MRAISNAMLWQMEVVQRNRWALGPLELVFVREPLRCHPAAQELVPPVSEGEKLSALQFDAMVYQWNQSASGGWVRAEDVVDYLTAIHPGLNQRENPNLIFVPQRADGLTQLHVMLASLLTDGALARLKMKRQPANIGLNLVGIRQLPHSCGERIEHEFSRLIWKKMSPAARLNASFFSPSSSLRLLAGDTGYWMHRLYRIAMERREMMFEPVKDDESWKPLVDLHSAVMATIPESERDWYEVRRPLYGGDVWNENDRVERRELLNEAINGIGVMDSLAPVVELLHARRAHEDFSERYSWIKEDFERQFYSKRAALKVELIETLDDAPVWSSTDNEGYGHALFRDVMAWLDRKERKLFLALRMGKTASEIAKAGGLSSHASISRRIARLKQKLNRILGQ
jgi:hypothetical protein